MWTVKPKHHVPCMQFSVYTFYNHFRVVFVYLCVFRLRHLLHHSDATAFGHGRRGHWQHGKELEALVKTS